MPRHDHNQKFHERYPVMKNEPTSAVSRSQPNENDIREYAYHLYLQSGGAPDHDLDNWLEATACLKANIPSHRSSARLHHHFNKHDGQEPSQLTHEAILYAI